MSEIKKKAILIKASGGIVDVYPKNGKDFKADELRELVGGYIEILDSGRSYFVCDEEGKLKRAKFNLSATVIGRSERVLRKDDWFVGNVLIVFDKKMIL